MKTNVNIFLICILFSFFTACKKDTPVTSDPLPTSLLPNYPFNPFNFDNPNNPHTHNTAVYYVDATNGNDANDGTSEATAWKTLGRLQRTYFKAGNAILLKRGESWLTENLFIGNGRDAVLNALVGISINTPTHDIMSAVIANTIQNLTYGIPDHPIEIDAYGTGNLPKVRTTRVNWTTGISITNIATYTGDTGDNATLIQYCDDIHIDNIYTTGMYTDYSINVTFRRILSENADEHGLYLCHKSKFFKIEDCIFRNNPGSGIQTNGEEMDSIVIRRCLSYGNNIAGYNDVRSYNVIFANNIFVAGGQGRKAVEVQMSNSGNRYYNNVFVSLTSGGPAVGLSSSEGITFKNNIFYVLTDALVGGNSSLVCDYNCFYAVNTTGNLPTMNWGTTFTAWKSGTGNDSHSLVADPKFVSIDLSTDPATWDLHLQASSPLIDQGTDVGIIFTGNAPDIGAFENN
jgi:hypothetical protein